MVLVGLTIIAFLSIIPVIGRRHTNQEAAKFALWLHQINGYVFIIIAVLIAQYCIRILGIWGHLSEPMVGLHILTAIPIVLIPIMKLIISRRYRGVVDSLLPPMGITLLLLTWLAAFTVIIHFYFG